MLYIKLIVRLLADRGAAATIRACGYIIFLNTPQDCKFLSEICVFLDKEMGLSYSTKREIYQIIIKNNWNENKTMRIVTEDLQPSTLSAKEYELLDGWRLFSSVGEIFLDNKDIEKYYYQKDDNTVHERLIDTGEVRRNDDSLTIYGDADLKTYYFRLLRKISLART